MIVLIYYTLQWFHLLKRQKKTYLGRNASVTWKDSPWSVAIRRRVTTWLLHAEAACCKMGCMLHNLHAAPNLQLISPLVTMTRKQINNVRLRARLKQPCHKRHFLAPVPVFWPHVRDVAATVRPTRPVTVLPATGSSIAERGACHPARAHYFLPNKKKKNMQWGECSFYIIKS